MAIFKKESFWESWLSFIKRLFDPLVLSVIIICILLSWASYSADNNIVKICFSVLAMLATGVLGAKGLHYYESGKLEEKGKSAIRSLKLMMNDLARFEKRVKTFLPIKSDSDELGITKTHFEEIVDKIRTL